MKLVLVLEGGKSTESTSVGRGPAYAADAERRNDTSGIANTESGSLTTTTIGVEEQRYVNSQLGLYFALFMVFAMGTLGMVLATNLIEFYVFFELVLLPSFFLISFFGYGSRHRTGLMFFFWTHAGSVVLLLGLLSIGFFAGGFDYSTVRAHVSQIPAQWMSIIIFAVVLGLGVKLGGFLLALLGSIFCSRSTYSGLNPVSRYCYLRYFTNMVRPFGWKLRPI